MTNSLKIQSQSRSRRAVLPGTMQASPLVTHSAIRALIAGLIGVAVLAISTPPIWAQDTDLRAVHAKAMSGDAGSQIEMALAHLRGTGVPADEKIGLAWVIAAAAGGDPQAIKMRARAFAQVQPDAVLAAEKLAFRIIRSIEAPKEPDGSSPAMTPYDLVYLASTGPAEQVRSFIDAGANVDSKAPDGRTPLLVSLQAQRFDIALILLKAGADTEATTPAGLTLLADAVEREDTVSIALLTKHGASVFAPDATGTPIFQSSYPETARRFLEIEARDMTRDEVREVQARLTAAGYAPGPIDGLIGRKTWSAFDALAADHGFTLAERNPNAVLEAVRTLVPTAEYRDGITKAARTVRAPVRQTASRARKQQRTAAEIFYGEDFTSGSAF